MSGNNDIPDSVRNPCQKNGHMTVVANEKLIAFGGYEVTSPQNDGNRVHLTSSYIRVFDFSKSIDLLETPSSVTTFQTLYHLPFRMPHVKWATMWMSSDGNTLNLWGGDHEVSAIMIGVDSSGNPIMSNQTRPLIDSSIWQVGVDNLANEDSWVQVNTTLYGNPVPLTRASYAVDNNSVAYTYGGIYEVGSYILANNSGWNPPVNINIEKSDLVTLDSRNTPATATNSTDATPIGMMIRGGMHYIPGVGNKGVMILFGGEGAAQTNNNIQRAWIYDLDSGKWYTQPLTAHNGNYPQPRLEFCSVLVSAGDGSSHNIFVTGGWQQPNTTAFAFNDVYVLTIPSFQWIYIGQAGVSKLDATCNQVGKYIIMYGGRRNSNLNGYNECIRDNIMQFYDMETLQWTTKFDYEASKASWKVPQQISSVIGGDESGGATALKPQGGFENSALQQIFKFTASNTNSTSNSTRTQLPSKSPSSSGHAGANAGAIAGGVVGGIVFLGLVAFVLYLLRRKNQLRKQQAVPGELPGDVRLPPQYADATEAECKSPVEAPPMEPVEIHSAIHAVEMDASPVTLMSPHPKLKAERM